MNSQNFIYHHIFRFALIGIISAILLAGCNDLINQTPRAEQTQATFFQDAGDAIEATNATYGIQRGFSFAFQFIGMTDIASDDAVKGSTPSDAAFQQELNDFTFDATNGAFQATYQAYYQGIFRANQGITNIPNISDDNIDPELRARLVGENKFLRAFYYFFLVRSYGGVPLVTKPQQPGEFDTPRASADSVYALIEQDLQDAIEVLPLKSEYASSEAGRATRGAAQGLLAKVDLFRGDFQQAEQLAQQVINSGEYALLPDYRNIFTTAGENSSESLYEVQAVALSSSVAGTQFGQVQGVRGQPNIGFGFNNPSDNLLATYEPGDPRLESTILFVYELLPSGEDVVRDNVNVPGDERYNQKYTIPPSNPGGTGNGGVNIRRLRYADVLLMAAEASFHNGNPSNAQNLVNQIRQRARNGQNATIGISVEPVPQLLVDTTGIDADQQGRPFIRLANPKGTGANAGLNSIDFGEDLQPAAIVLNNLDIIQSIDGVNISNPDDYLNEMRTKSPGQPVTVQILRVSQTGNGGPGSTSTQTLQFTVPTEQLLPDITASGQELLEAIWRERRIELAMEQQRLFDLRRQGRSAEVLGALPGVNYTQGTNDLYPIPQVEVDIGSLEQNPGY